MSTFKEKIRSLFSYRSPSKSRLKRNITLKKSQKDFAKCMEVTSRFSSFLLDTELTPVELIWVQVKSEVVRKNTTFKIAEVKCLMNNALQGVTRLNWSKAINHVLKVEDAFCKVNFGDRAPHVEPFIVQLNELDTEASDTDPDLTENDGFYLFLYQF